MGKTEPARFSADETFDVGMDTSSPVSNRLQIAERVYGQTWESRFATDFAYEVGTDSQSRKAVRNSQSHPRLDPVTQTISRIRVRYE
jgi:hypothetical protein